ncbi:MAG: SpoIIE family protein phosphatase [Bacteroidetes bacterium]|nr:SpoIIE family protein phosphatase [Bacteroidota bacterium]
MRHKRETLKNRSFFLLLLLSLLPYFHPSCFGQSANGGIIVVEGLVSGYNHDPTRKLLQKEKPIILEGTLERVAINVLESGTSVFTALTNKKGEFELRLALGKIYRVELTKNGRTKTIFLIDVRAVPPEIAAIGIKFIGAELVMNSFLSKDTTQVNQPFGRLYYDVRKKMMDFEPAQVKVKSGLFARQEEPNTSASLMKRAVLKNRDNVINDQKNILTTAQVKKWKKMTKPVPATTTENTETPPPADTVRKFTSRFKLGSNIGVDQFSEDFMRSRESEIEAARKQLEEDKANAKTAEDSLLIKGREELLNAAVIELSGAKKMIAMQKNQITTQRNLLYLAIFSLALVFAFLFFLFKHSKDKKKNHILLKEKTKKITDSINYAKYIQQSILPQESDIQKLLPHSFIYYQPRDIVSGDFYWVSAIGNKIVIAAVDCTGHGVPGAFMSLIGNTLLNEIINEKKIVEPSAVLELLHAGIFKSLNQNASEINCQDGMEMSLCVIDHQQKIIQFAGAMNPIYIVRGNTLTIIKADMQAIGGIRSAARKNTAVEFSTQQIPIHEGMTLYMFTDGYMDQFGGTDNKKFNTQQFKKMLLDIQPLDMDKQKQTVEQTMKNWKGNYKQIDDMLVIGLRF